MIKINLSTEEIELLQQYAAKASIELLRLKAHAILLRSQDVLIKHIAFSVGRSGRTIERWVKDYSERRLASIFSGMRNNQHAAKLTRGQKAEIKKVLQQPPSEHGLPRKFWDVSQLKDYVKAEFGIVYESDQSYHFLLHFGKLSFKYPDKFDIRRDEKVIEKRMEEIRKEIQPFLNDPNCEVFASDETGLYFEALVRKAWIKRGKKTVVKVNRSREKQDYLGFLNLKNGQCETYRITYGKQEYILPAIEKHIVKYPNKRIVIIWDNATSHKGKLIKEALKKGNNLDRVHLIALPPYAPDTNPIEHVWKEGKRETTNKQFTSFDLTKIVFEHAISSRTFNYQI